MSFAHAWVLMFLALPAALFIFELRRRGRTVPLPLDFAHLRPRGFFAAFTPAMLKCAALLPALLLAIAVILLAAPKRLGPPGQDRILTNIEICLDVSGSMMSPMAAATEVGATRYTTAMAAINYFTANREGDAFGLTIFGIDTVRWVPLTKDLSAIRNATPFLNPATQPPQLQGTRVGNALRFANQVLTAQPGEGDRLIIVVTDGFSSDLDGGASAQIASEMQAAGIVVHGIHVGDGAPPQQLSEVVTPTGGQVFSAANLPTLSAAFDHISKMHKIKIKPTQREPIDFFGPFALAGLALTGLFAFSLIGVRYTPW